MADWQIITAIIGGLVFVGLWIDKLARKHGRKCRE